MNSSFSPFSCPFFPCRCSGFLPLSHSRPIRARACAVEASRGTREHRQDIGEMCHVSRHFRTQERGQPLDRVAASTLHATAVPACPAQPTTSQPVTHCAATRVSITSETHVEALTDRAREARTRERAPGAIRPLASTAERAWISPSALYQARPIRKETAR